MVETPKIIEHYVCVICHTFHWMYCDNVLIIILHPAKCRADHIHRMFNGLKFCRYWCVL